MKEKSIAELINDNDLDILALTETWLSHEEDPSIELMKPPGYTFKHNPRDTRGGGVGLLFRESYKITKVKSKKYKSFEHHTIGLSHGSESIRITTFYNPDGVCSDEFSVDLNEFLNKLLTNNNVHHLILGDFNFHMDVPSDSNVKKFLEILDIF